jgi:DNA invertase Pin-like site-specific DNA recombinase
MTGKRIGYKRVSTKEQSTESQLIGIELDKIFDEIETGYSTKDRHKLKELIDYVREDDVVFVECMDRLGRNGYDLDDTVEALLKKGVQINFVREGIILGKKNDLMSKLAYDMMKSFIHFFSQLFKERQKIGIEKAKKNGKYNNKPRKLNKENIDWLRQQLTTTRKSVADVSKELKVSRTTIYTYIKENNISYGK